MSPATATRTLFSLFQNNEAACNLADNEECFVSDISSFSSSSTITWLWTILALYLLSEVLFYMYFHFHLVPHANRRTTPDLYHDFPRVNDRIRLLQRILTRLEQKAARRCNKQDGQDATESFHNVIKEYLLQWFDYVPPSESTLHNENAMKRDELCLSAEAPITFTRSNSLGSHSSGPPALRSLLTTASSSTVSSNSSCASAEDGNSSVQSDEEDTTTTAASQQQQYTISMAPWTIPGLTKLAAADFFAWAFFAKDTCDLSSQEQTHLDECFQYIETCTGLALNDSATTPSLYEPRRLSLETVQALHRPWLVYAMVAVSQFVTRNLVLPAFGFRRVQADSVNLTAWYRPASKPENRDKVCLFFHGIAPSGLGCYLPMIQSLLGKRQQSLVMFENPSVQCQFHPLPYFHALAEEETVWGVHQILSQLELASSNHALTLMGHSFGSCPITWILRRRNHFDNPFREVVLLDPVTLLLSEPTVMSRFLYDREDKDKAHIRFLVASELFTETYLRRHFCWYNSELNMEDFCSNPALTNDEYQDDDKNHNNDPQKWTIVLSGMDEIVPSPVVQEHVAALQANAGLNNCNLVYWPHARHANCVMSPLRWRMMRTFLFQDDDDE